MAAAFYY